MAGTAKTKTLTEALIEFQKDLPSVGLDSTNPAFKSKYASLGAVTKAVIPKLTEHGFAFSVGSFVENGLLVVDAHLIHESGESRSLQFPITETLPQKVGSAITYARRYALAALTGVVADEDDDGNAASQQTVAEKRIEQARQTPQPAQAAARTQDSDSQAAVRKWIGNDDARKEQANAARERIKKEQNLSGEALFAAVKAEVGA
ncbi:ssDNA binding protein [Microbacterium phage WaterT]|nr:ssDNA binding protein [Microbacterium phage WaterT]